MVLARQKAPRKGGNRMSTSRIRVFEWGLVAAAFFALFSLSLGAGEARAGNCATMNFTFNLGSANTCNTSTQLDSTGAGNGLRVFGTSLIAIAGETTAMGGVGVDGFANSSSINTRGVEGNLGSSTPGTGSAGVLGYSVSGTANGPGVWGWHASSAGTAPGVLGETSSTSNDSAGVKGLGGSCGYCIGVYGSVPGNGIGVRGETPPATNAWGVEGIGGGNSGIGVYGHTPASSSTNYGVEGVSGSTGAAAAGVFGTIDSSADYSGGVRGENFNATCCGFGVVGFHAGQGIGIGGYAPNGFGVFGWSPNNWAAYFDGAVSVVRDLHVHGTLYKAGGAFRIDKPLDPAHSYLQHSFVESPQMMNVYKGHVVTNDHGFATVTLPRWFQALNRDFEYQLTVVGKAHWDAKAAIWQEVKDNRFTIRTDQANVKVSWQVTGVRHDPYANAHRIQVLVPKEGKAEGTYLHPKLYGQPHSKSETALPGIARGMPKLKAPASPALPKQH
jgi:hypothetical protein